MFIGGRRRSRRRSRRSKRRGGTAALAGVVRKGALPASLFLLNQMSRKHKRHRRGRRHGTRKGMVRRTARRAYMR